MLMIVNILVVAAAIGFLIFFHELGHFLAAKKVGIRVHAFSIGFGPRLIGFRRGETDYKLCLFPLGGYVGMAGEAPGTSGGDPGDFSSKTIGQRVLVVSAGVIANVILALIIFPLAYGVGVPVKSSVVGSVAPGSPAWKAGLLPGDRITEIEGTEIKGFSDVQMEVAFGDDALDVVVDRGGQTRNLILHPVYSETLGAKAVGIGPANEERPIVNDPEALGIDVPRGSTIMEIDGRDSRYLEEELIALSSQWPKAQGAPLAIVVETPSGERKSITLKTEVKAPSQDAPWSVGLLFAALQVKQVMPNSPAADLGLSDGDLILAVGGQRVLGPLDLRDKLLGQDRGDGEAEVAVRVRRPDGSEVERRATLDRIARERIMNSVTLYPVPLVARVDPGGPAEAAGLLAGDTVVSARGIALPPGERAVEKMIEIIRESRGETMSIGVERQGKRIDLEVTPGRRGLNATLSQLAVYRPRTDEVRAGFPESIGVGLRQTGNQFMKIILSFRALLTGEVAARNMGGILTISVATYTFVEQGLGKLLWFMAFLSLNLAFLNILPIPVLDGGHLAFLIYEKIKGRPLSEKAMGIANLGGFALIICLMLFVTFNDVVRFFF
jgi:regulator of sigma E protease